MIRVLCPIFGHPMLGVREGVRPAIGAAIRTRDFVHLDGTAIQPGTRIECDTCHIGMTHAKFIEAALEALPATWPHDE